MVKRASVLQLILAMSHPVQSLEAAVRPTALSDQTGDLKAACAITVLSVRRETTFHG